MHLGMKGWSLPIRAGLRQVGGIIKEKTRSIESHFAYPPSCGPCAGDRLLIETDAPYLTPRTITPSKARPQRNEPALLPYVLEKVAAARGETPEQTAALARRNAHELFGPLGG